MSPEFVRSSKPGARLSGRFALSPPAGPDFFADPSSSDTIDRGGKLASIWIALIAGALCFAADLRAETARILLIGDSQSVGTFGRRLPSVLMKRVRAQVAVVARCGATTAHYLEEGYRNCGYYERTRNGRTLGPASGHRPVELLDVLLDWEQPRIVIFQLGGNSLRQSRTQWERQAQGVLEVVSGREALQCYWVGPPPGWARPQDRFHAYYDFMTRTLEGKCHLFDSRQGVVYPEGTGDGVHLDRIRLSELHKKFGCSLDGSDAQYRPECLSGPQRASKWAESVASWILRISPEVGR